MARLRIGELLVEAKVITQAQLDAALRATRSEGQKIGSVLIEQQLVTETQLTQTLGQQLSVPWVSLSHIDFSRTLLEMVPVEMATRLQAVPIFVRNVKNLGNSLYVAMDDPTNEAALAELTKQSGLPVKPMIACLSDIRNAIRIYYAPSGTGSSPNAAPLGATVAPGRQQPRVAPTLTPPAAPPSSVNVTAAHAQASGPGPRRERTPLSIPPESRRVSGRPPPAPRTGRAPLPTVMDGAELVQDRMRAMAQDQTATARASQPSASQEPAAEGPGLARGSSAEGRPSGSAPPGRARSGAPATSSASPPASDASPASESPELSRRKARRRMLSLTLLDGTTVNMPPKGEAKAAEPAKAGGDPPTAAELLAAVRAMARGGGESPEGAVPWPVLCAALLSLLLKKQVVTEREILEELRRL